MDDIVYVTFGTNKMFANPGVDFSLFELFLDRKLEPGMILHWIPADGYKDDSKDILISPLREIEETENGYRHWCRRFEEITSFHWNPNFLRKGEKFAILHFRGDIPMEKNIPLLDNHIPVRDKRPSSFLIVPSL